MGGDRGEQWVGGGAGAAGFDFIRSVNSVSWPGRISSAGSCSLLRAPLLSIEGPPLRDLNGATLRLKLF